MKIYRNLQMIFANLATRSMTMQSLIDDQESPYSIVLLTLMKLIALKAEEYCLDNPDAETSIADFSNAIQYLSDPMNVEEMINSTMILSAKNSPG